MRIAARLLILPCLLLPCLAGCTPPLSLDGVGAGIWPDRQVTRDVAAIRAGMEQVRRGEDRMAETRNP
ncbi:MAG: hypothetical protein KGL52_11470 [Rhodospirillales bacterium]|jgi:hypothetical protein|nr:hypothetical protein [Rhodospirillales bacterium]